MPASPYSLLPKLKAVAKEVGDAAESVIEAYRAGRIGDEEDITARMVQAIEDAVRPVRRRRRAAGSNVSVSWTAKTLRTGRGVAAEEGRHGADLLAVAEINYAGSVVTKGFLGQAKRVEPGAILVQSEWERLQAQVRLMLELTPDAFVLLYSKHYGVRFVSALTVAQVGRRDLFELSAQTLREFFEWHLACFIGDRTLDEPHIRTLDDLRGSPRFRDLPISNFLRLTVTFEGP